MIKMIRWVSQTIGRVPKSAVIPLLDFENGFYNSLGKTQWCGLGQGGYNQGNPIG